MLRILTTSRDLRTVCEAARIMELCLDQSINHRMRAAMPNWVISGSIDDMTRLQTKLSRRTNVNSEVQKSFIRTRAADEDVCPSDLFTDSVAETRWLESPVD